jgi:hypothetical protein
MSSCGRSFAVGGGGMMIGKYLHWDTPKRRWLVLPNPAVE